MRGAHGWRGPLRHRPLRLLCATLAGTLLAATLPPLDVTPALVAWAALVGLSLEGERWARRRWLERALLGAAFGFGFHVAGLWWTGAAFLVDLDTFGPFLPLAVVGLPLLLAPFDAAAMVLVGLAPRTPGWRVVALALAVSATEFARGVVLTGFPWNVPAVQLSGSLLLVQAAGLIGVHGLAVPTVLIGAAPAALVRGSRWAAGLGLAALVALAGYGAVRLAAVAPPDGAIRVRIVQPAVPQDEKWDPGRARDIWGRLIALSTAPGSDGSVPPIVIWPETAVPFLYTAPSVAQAELADALDGRTLVTGAVAIEPTPDGPEAATNSIFVIAADGAVVQRYDKIHLVPFGEYLPFAPLLSRLGLTKLVEGSTEFAAGADRPLLTLPGLPPALPLICYEVIFRQDGQGASFVLNVTNDAWFGDTPGPRQHLRHAQLRAIESGLPVVRAANNGISGVIDATGELRARIELNRSDVLDANIPGATTTGYVRWGDRPLFALWTLLLAVSLAYRRVIRNESRRIR